MSAPGTTPGPWFVDSVNGDIVSGPVNVSILYATKAEDRILMAASQKLYDACAAAEDFLAAMPADDGSLEIYKQLHAALCAARGDAS
ncbi:hypothetical protein [Sphingomonas sp. TREG-RG-20F-R18-01]|uniref:hypothetical protein n=1 Tax=Sphingomonas sp. TREG-RG-20F-R18-01 TaxID=2914982 RepID=UPI001F5871E1|nr:hypothetical protein [Sphingomonas sp. TREG-RG-20F-R18-01]